MYGFPDNLDYSQIVGQFTTQICVGQFDLQFTFGEFRFIAQSPVSLLKDGAVIGVWDGASWPEPAFYDMMNVAVTGVDLPDSRNMRIFLENGMTVVLFDDSDRYETLQIIIGKAPGVVHII